MADDQKPQPLTPSGEWARCHHEGCPSNPEVVTTPRLMGTLTAALEGVVSWKTLLYLFGGFLVVLLASVGGVLSFAYAQNRDAGEAQIAPVKADVEAMKAVDVRADAKIEAVKQDVAALRLTAARTEVMVEMLVKDREMRPPPKVTLDGGP